jgi:DNA-binding NarL/FixJ family response regulator
VPHHSSTAGVFRFACASDGCHLDIAMPALNGLDASQQVKEILPAVKLVFLTGDGDHAFAAEASRKGPAIC